MAILIYTKDVDKSVLTDGFTIQTALLAQFVNIFGRLAIGASRQIKIALGNHIYDGIVVKNQNFNRQKYPTHVEMYQVRYSKGSEFSKALNETFRELSDFIKIQLKLKKEGQLRGNIKVPEELRCQIAFYASENPDVWIAEPVMAVDFRETKEELKSERISELQFENWQKLDENAGIRVRQRAVKSVLLTAM